MTKRISKKRGVEALRGHATCSKTEQARRRRRRVLRRVALEIRQWLRHSWLHRSTASNGAPSSVQRTIGELQPQTSPTLTNNQFKPNDASCVTSKYAMADRS